MNTEMSWSRQRLNQCVDLLLVHAMREHYATKIQKVFTDGETSWRNSHKFITFRKENEISFLHIL